MPATPTTPVSPLLTDMSGALTQMRLAVRPGDVLHAYGARLLVLNTRFGTTEYGERQELSVVAVSHEDARATWFHAWSMGLDVEYARRESATAESPQPSTRRWWLAVSLDDKRRFSGANGFRDGSDCTICAPRPLDPARREYEPCRNAHAHAWNQIGDLDRIAPGRRHYVLGPIAETWEQAREIAAETCERIRTVGHL
ncbi:hypothetical protein [Streptomyces sp. MBT27]|uniref:hypothetical protein n=1 Tax=Streptomyces sp. MBT27 TaxID=1488356 RepID=UPI0014246DE9|nr:hypothetical protein [Streptomyces sp. MBT27]